MKSFLLPLFARGWRISPDPDSSELQVELGSAESVVRLKTRYRFAQSYHAIAFVKECLEIMEKLHVRFLKYIRYKQRSLIWLLPSIMQGLR